MFNYLTTTKNLHNVLWVYSPDHSRGNRLAYYPGAAYVDIVALDVYTDDPVGFLFFFFCLQLKILVFF